MEDENQTLQSEVKDEEMKIELKPYSLNTLLIVKAAQNQNGLRHNDYTRYHHYCVSKMHRLRKILKCTQQGGNKPKVSQKYTKNEISG